MKVCILCEFMTGAYREGTQIITLEMAKALKERGHEPVILAPVWHEGDKKIEADIEVQTFSGPKIRNPYIRILYYITAGFKLHRKRKVDVFVGLYTLAPSLAAIFLGTAFGKKKVATIWEPVACEKAKRFPFSSGIFNKTDGILTMVEGVKDIIVDSLSVPRDLVRVVPGFYDSALFMPGEKDKGLIETYGLEKKFVLLFVGRVSTLKGVPQILEAVKDVDDIKVLFVGRETQHENFRSMVSRLGIDDKIVFVGYTAHEELPKFYQTCDCFIFPSLNEGFALVLAEAMACGKPVIISDTPPMPEVAGSGGVVVKAGDAEGLKNAIISVKKSNERYNELSKNALVQSKKFEHGEVMAQYVEFFEGLFD